MSKNKKVSNAYYAYGVLYQSERFYDWEESKTQDYHEYRKAWSERLVDFDAGEFPLNLNVEVTTNCNLACTFCTHPSLDESQMIDLPIEIYEKAVVEGAKLGLAAVNLNGLGEPLLRKDLVDFIKIAKENGVVDAMFHTNGTIMTEKIAKNLIDAGLDKIIFSVDSPDKKTYEAMRLLRKSFLKNRDSGKEIDGTKWEKTVSNVRQIADVRDTKESITPIIRATMVVTENTVEQVDDYLDLWRDTVDVITVQDLTWRTKLLDNDVWENKEKSAVPKEFDDVRDHSIEENTSFVCPYLFQSTYIHSDGSAIPCSNPNARKHMIMGNYYDESASEIWNGEKYKALRKLHVDGKWHEHPVCRDCEVALVELYKEQAIQDENIIARSGSYLQKQYLKDAS